MGKNTCIVEASRGCTDGAFGLKMTENGGEIWD